MFRFLGARAGVWVRTATLFSLLGIFLTLAHTAHAVSPDPGGDILATTTGGGGLSIAEDTMTATDFRVSGINQMDADGGTPTEIRLTAVDGGTVTTSADGAIVIGEKGVGDALSLTGDMIDLKFVPDPDRAADATIMYKMVDPEGPDADSTASTITIDITPVADAPEPGGDILATTTGGGALSIPEDTGTPTDFRVSGINQMDVDGGTPAEIRLTAVDGGTVTTSGDGAIVIGEKGVGDALSLTGDMIDLKFEPDPDRDTNATITYKMVDPEGPSADSTASTITITITPADDSPEAGGPILATTTGGGALSIPEDTATPTDFRVSGINLMDADGSTPDEIRLTAVDGGTVTTSADGAIILGEKGVGDALMLTGSMIDLKFVPDADRDTDAEITYKVVDPEGPAADSPASTITISITAINDAPDMSDGNLADINEDDTDPPGASLTSLFSGSFTDPDGTFFGVAVVSNPELPGEGVWEYNPPSGNSNDWYPIASVNDTGSALVLRADTNVRFLPAAQYDGPVTPITMRPLDNNYVSGFSNKVSGSENRVTVDTTMNGDPTAIGGTPRALNTNVIGMNDAPTIATNVTLTVNQGESAFITSSLLAATDEDDVDSTLLFTVTGGPSRGTLNLTPTFTQANINGNALQYTHDGTANNSDSFTFNVQDDDMATSSPDDTFSISVNLTPTVTMSIADVAVNENAPNEEIDLIDVFDDPEDGDGGFTYSVSNVTNGALFTSLDFDVADLVIDFAPDSPGTSMVTVRATDDMGAFVEDTFQVSVNDRPEADADNALTNEDNAVAINVLNGDTDSDGSIDATTVNVTSGPSNGGTSVNPTTGVVTYTPTGDFNGADSFQYTVDDNLGFTSAAATVSITVSAVNDPPGLVVPGTTQDVSEGNTLTISTAAGNAITITDVDADETAFGGGTGGVNVSLSATKGTMTLASTTNLANITGNGTATVSFDGTISDSANALDGLTYTPAPLVNGADTMTINVSDKGNTGSGGVLTAMDTIDINIIATNDPPVVTVPGAQTVDEDTQTGITGISVADPDAGGNDIVVTLSVPQGTLAVNASAVGGVSSITGNNSNSVELTGTVTQQNATLATVTFQSAQNSVSDQSITVAADDQGNTGGPAETDSANIAVSVTPQNDAPTFTNFPGATQAVDEDTPLPFSVADGNRISISDVDHQENNPAGVVEVTLSANNGTVTLNGTAGLTSVTGDGTATVSAQGSTVDWNVALNGLVYQGDEHFNGSDQLTVTLNDLGNTGAGGGTDVSMSVNITVNAVNDPPVITDPGTQMAEENTNFPFVSPGNPIVIADVDVNESGGDLDVTLDVTNGILTLATTAGLTNVAGNGSASVSFSGTPAAINNALDGLIYRAVLDYNGNDTLEIDVDDDGATGSGPTGTDSASILIEVGAVNNAPTVIVPGAQTIDEDTTAAVTGISVADVDAASGNLEVTLSVGAGNLTVTPDLTGGVNALDIGNNGSNSVTLTGTLGELNTTLGSLTFITAQDNASTQTLAVMADDQGNTGDGGPKTTMATVALNIVAQNDDPVITVPATQTTNEEAALLFSTGLSNAITVTDVDVAESAGDLVVALSVSHGRLSLSSTSGLTFNNGDGTNDTAMTFRGTATNINNALNGLTYQPDQHFNTEAGQSESLEIVANDGGDTGAGGGGDVANSVAISVIGLNDDPVLTVPGPQSVNEDTPLAFNGSISVSDVDVAESAGTLRLTLSASNGAVTLAQTTGLTITPPATGTNDASVTITGTAANINAALDGLTYQGNPDFNGSDTISLALNDQGNTGQGGGGDVTDNIAVTVIAVNDAPVASAATISPAEPLRNEDLTASYTYSDVDSDPESGTTIRWFRDNVLQPAFNDLTTVPMSATVEEEVWFFRVTPRDGALAGTEVQSNSVSIRPVADLQIFIARDPSQVVPGESVTYTFQVRNLGPSPVTGASVTSTLPAALQNVTWTCTACGTNGSGGINESIDLASGETVEYALTALVDPSANGDLTVSGAVDGPALVFETDAGNNTASDTVPLMPEAMLDVDIAANTATIGPGGTITYTVTATNQGPSDAQGVFFEDTPDVNTTLIAGQVTSTVGTVVTGNNTGDTTVSVNVGAIPLGDTATITYQVQVASPFPAEGMAMVCTRGQFFGEAGNPDVNFVDVQPPADACTTIDTTVLFAATNVDTLFSDANGDGVVNPGDTVRYTVHIENSGNGGANGVTYTQPAIANGSLIEDSVAATPPAENVSINSGALTVALGSIEGDNGAGDGSNEATIVFNVVVVNPLPPGEAFLVSQGDVSYDELPAGAAPIQTDDPDAVPIGNPDLVPVDENGDVVRPAPTATPVVASPALVVLKSDDITRDEEKRPGDLIEYTVTIENEGDRGAADLFYRNPFRDEEISIAELQLVDGTSPLIDVATSLLSNFNALDVDNSDGLSSGELDGSVFALTPDQFDTLDLSDARITLLPDSITVDGEPAANMGSETELLLDLGALDGRNPQFTNGPMITITFSVELNDVLLEGINTIRSQGQVESDVLAPVLSDDPETVNSAFDATVTFVRAIPEIDIEPEILTIDFGDQDIDDGPTASRAVTISNAAAATANLTLGFIGLEGADLSEYVIVSDTGESVLGRGETRTIEVAFDPDSIGNKIASLRIESDDPNDSAVDVNLSGRALDSDIRVTPSTLDFGKRNLLAGPSNPQSVSIINDGLGILTLDSVTLACGPDIFPVMTQSRFDQLDRNGDGVLTTGVGQMELENAIDLFDLAEALIDNFDSLDGDGSNSLTPAEVSAEFPFLNASRFDVLDDDLSGGLSQLEIDRIAALATFAESLLDSFADFDTNPPAGLDFSEALEILPDLTEAQFGDLDINEDGVLGTGELDEKLNVAAIATQLGVDFFGLDTNQDGVLDLEEIETYTPLLTPGRFDVMDSDGNGELTATELETADASLADDILADFGALDTDGSGGLTLSELSSNCDFEIFSDSGEESLETAQSRLVRVVFDPSTPGMKVGTLRIEANQQGQGTPIVEKVTLFGTGNRTPRIVDQNPVSTLEDTPVTIILDNLIVDSPLLDFPDELTLAFQPRPADANYTRDGNTIIPNRNFNGVLFVPVTVRDGDIDSNVWRLRISVAPVNDPPTGISLDNTTIAENQVLNTVVGRFQTADPDLGDLHIYSLVPDDPETDDDDFIDNEFFGIVANQLVSRIVFDYETRNAYTILVRSRDPAGLTVERAFNINILDQANDEDNSVAAEVLLNSFDDTDTNGDGSLSLAEIQALLPGFTEVRFDALNTEKEVSRAEIQAGVDRTANAEQLFDRFELADTNEDEVLSFREARSQASSLIREHYDYMDANGDGELTPSEIQTAILLHGDLSDVLEDFDNLDADGSRHLTFDEVPRSASTLNRTRFEALEGDSGISPRELEALVTCRLEEGSIRLVQPTGDLLAPPAATLLDVTFNAEVDVNVGSACNADNLTFTYDIGAESILATDLAEYFLRNFDALDADFNDGLALDEVAFSRLGITAERFDAIDFDGDGFLIREELDASIVLSDFAGVLLDSFAALNADNSTGLSFAETQDAGIDLDNVRYGVLDLNDNGVLTRQELEAEIDLPAYLLNNFDALDGNNDDGLSPAEVRATLPGLSDTRFNNIDADGDGFLVTEELQSADDFGKRTPVFAAPLPPGGIQKQLRGQDPATFTLPVNNAYRVRVTATLRSTGQSIQSSEFTFEIRNGTDDNDNGYLDRPFQELTNDGARWQRTVPAANCARVVTTHYWRGTNIPGPPIEVSLATPGKAGQQLDLVVPHGLLNEGEEGLLLVTLACDGDSLFTRLQAESLDPFPVDPVAGTPWFNVSVVARTIGEEAFTTLGNSRFERRPIRVSLSGLSFSPEDQATFYNHSSLVIDDLDTGYDVAPGLETWNGDTSLSPTSESGTLRARLQAAGAFVALESLKPPILVTTPVSSAPVNFGEVQVNESVEKTITITNQGGEQLIGTVELRDAADVFSVIGEASYDLGHGETHSFIIRFSPNAANEFAGAITYSGDGKGLITTAVTGTGMAPKGFGCGAGSPGGYPVGDFLAMLITLAALLVYHGRGTIRGVLLGARSIR